MTVLLVCYHYFFIILSSSRVLTLGQRLTIISRVCKFQSPGTDVGVDKVRYLFWMQQCACDGIT